MGPKCFQDYEEDYKEEEKDHKDYVGEEEENYYHWMTKIKL